MLVAERPFTGPPVQAIVARLMTESTRPVTAQRRSVPGNFNAAVLKALEKLPADRFTSAAEFSKALVTPGFDVPSVSNTGSSASERSRGSGTLSWLNPALAWAIAGAAALAAIAIWARTASDGDDVQPMQLAIDVNPGMELQRDRGDILAIAEDGSRVAIGFVANGTVQIALRRLDEDRLNPVAGSNGVLTAAFSQSGRWIAFNADEKI